MKSKITVFGSFVVDLMARTPSLPIPGETVKGSMFKMGAGGKGFNQCVAAHKAGADVVMCTKLGKDTFADVALNTMTALNMPKDYIFTDDTLATGIALILVDENTAQNEIVIVSGACGNITDADIAKVAPRIKESEYIRTPTKRSPRWPKTPVSRSLLTRRRISPLRQNFSPAAIWSPPTKSRQS